MTESGNHAVAARRAWQWATALVLIVGSLVVQELPAWAPHVGQLLVSPTSVTPGGTINVTGTRGYGPGVPVDIHLDAFDGPVLVTVGADQQFYAAFGPIPVTIPPGTAPGVHSVVATQTLPYAPSTYIRNAPPRALIQVLGPGERPLAAEALAAKASPPPDLGRPSGLRAGGASTGLLVLIGVIAFIGALVLGAVVVLVARRSPSGTPETAAMADGTRP